jgi:hypothetical protein
MFKHIASFTLIVLVMLSSSSADARTKKKKKSRAHTSARTRKVSKHARKSRRFHHGTGPDLKSITTDSPYKEDPNNGVTPVETKQPEL